MSARELMVVGILVVIVILMSAVFHSTRRSYLLASALSAISSSVLFQVVSYLENGHLDALWIIGLIMGTLGAFIGSLIVGLPFLIHRRRQGEEKGVRSRFEE